MAGGEGGPEKKDGQGLKDPCSPMVGVGGSTRCTRAKSLSFLLAYLKS
jgi:hypothetical protein